MAAGDGLNGANRDVFVAISEQLKAWGLESLAGSVADLIKQNYSSDTINILIQDTDAYKKRFAANEARRNAGLAVLSPAEYLRTELAYRQVMQAAGLPPGFYDEPSDFQKWIELDVSPNEIQSRVKTAQAVIESADPEWRNQFEQWYSHGELVAYALDQKRTSELLAKQAQAAQIGVAVKSQGVDIEAGFGERIAERGISQAQAEAGFGQVAFESRVLGELGKVWGTEFTQDDSIESMFFSSEEAQAKKRRLIGQERAAFSGRSGIAPNTTLKTTRQGAV